MSYEEFIDLLENSQGNKNKTSLIQEYTSETNKLIKMLNELYPLLDVPKTKNTVTRLENKLTANTPDFQIQHNDDILEP